MQVNQTDIIRFLMDEMDPSEKISFEQRIRLDQDLLIEVESLKKTWQKTSTIPSFTTPKHLKEAIFDQAEASIAISANKWNWQGVQRHAIKIAASFLVMATVLIAWNTWIPVSNADNATSANTSVTEQHNSNTVTHSNRQSTDNNNTGKRVSEITPWIDQNHIIRFAGTTEFNLNQPQEITSSTQQNSKLRLVNDKTGYTGQSRKILLTGNTP